MSVPMWRLVAGMILGLLSIGPCGSSEPADTIRVAIHLNDPLVAQDAGSPTGFSVDLWRELAARLQLKTEFQVDMDEDAVLASVREHRAQLGIAGIAITSAREREFDFSQPIMNSGLLIMLRGSSDSDVSIMLTEMLPIMFSPLLFVWLAISFILIIIPAHVMWMTERKREDGFIPTEKYIPGIFHALWWAASTLATQAAETPRGWLSRLTATLWMLTSFVFVTYYTAQLTAFLTVQQFQGKISSPADLPGKAVATTHGSAAARFLTLQRAKVIETAHVGQAYAALLDKRVDAVVMDAPVLLSLAEGAGRGKVRIVGSVFHREDFGIVYPQGSQLRERIDRELLRLREDGTFARIHERWFGTGHDYRLSSAGL